MKLSLFTISLVTGLLCVGGGLAQSNSLLPSNSSLAPSQQRSPQPSDLAVLRSSKTAVNAWTFLFPVKCDHSGNLYLRNAPDGVPGLHKLSPEGKQLLVIEPKGAVTGEEIDRAAYFSLTREDYVYQIVSSWKKRERLVYVYRPDGSLKSYVKLNTKFPWTAAQVAAFPSGNILVTGLEYDRDLKAARWPFNGIFSPEGNLIKEIKLADDEQIHDMAAVGDARVAPPEAPGVNHAVGLGAADLADDGNIYLMRRLSPAIIYAISPSGEVLRRFTVDAGPDYMPDSMHISGNRIAVQLDHPQSGDQIIKVVDLEGHEVASYHLERGSPLGYAIACYSANPDRFTFLGDEDSHLTLDVAGPK